MFMILLTSTFGQLPPNDPVYELVFNDDFNGTSVDYTKWDRIPPWNQGSNITTVCNPNVTTSVAYRKWQTNIPGQMDTTNCKVSNGSVKLYTRKENYDGEVWSWPNGIWTRDTIPFQYTTAMLLSKNIYRFGYFEIRFRLPQPPNPPKRHLGFGPNFWMFGADTDGSEGWVNHWSEIDVFEINSFDIGVNNNLYTNNAHYRNCDNSSCHIQDGQAFGYISNNTWHTAAVNWTPSKIEFYLDGNKLREFPCNQLNYPPDSLVAMPMWVDINSPATNFCMAFDTINSNGTSFPYIYEIDYVKVWQLKQACDTAKLYCNFVPTNYNSKLYKSVTIGGTNCNSTISNQSNTSIYATDYILLNEGVSIDNQSNVLFNIEDCRDNQFGVKSLKSLLLNNPNPPPPAFIERQKCHY